uniref:c-type cytochrome biogenesis protein CcmI n=1 Tax=Marimonas arenosa TaxID=1795305 RepID=UPI0027D29FA5|nr:c-type cytochrome biogenesis protein CcmI [Marimonas arenosa]
MIFWITAAALAVALAALLVIALLRGKADAEHPAAYDLRVYRDQLKEVDRDLARGVIGEEDAERVRAEVGRRVLAADAQLQQAQSGSAQPRGATLALSAIVVAALMGGTFALYPVLGEPGARDLPLKTRIALSDEMRQSRLSQAEAEAQLPPSPTADPDPRFAELMEKLRMTVKDRPDDLQGHLLLARNEASLGNFKAAYAAQRDVIRIKGEQAAAIDHAVLAELLISAAEGYVSPEAEDALRAALEKDPGNQPARYYTGLMLIQNDRPDIAFRFWKRLLEEGPETAPWIPVIRDQIEELAWRAGVDYTPPEPQQLAGPSADDMAAAANMTPEERREMIHGMVARLNERLATEGGTPQEWAQLIGGLGVLGDTERARAIWDEAQQVFAAEPGALDIVRAGAVRAGLVDSADATSPALPPDGGLTGPSRDDIANAAEMSAEERQEMIRGMVSQLSERLAEDGGSAQEWVRLITSQAILGDLEAARAAYDAALAAHGEDDTARATIEAAAQRAGLQP